MFDLNGEYLHKVDDKGRLSMPAKFRKNIERSIAAEAVKKSQEDPASVGQGELSKLELVVVKNIPEGCLYVFTEGGFNKWVDSFFPLDVEGQGGYDVKNPNHVGLRRELKACAMETEVDGSGRIKLSPAHKEFAQISTKAVLIGNTNYFEIWHPELREQAKAKINLANLMYPGSK